MADVFYDAHVQVYVRADEQKRVNTPPVVPEIIELRRKLDLGAYTAAEYMDLLAKIEETVEEWVEAHPPHVSEE